MSLEAQLAESLRIARGEPVSTELPARRVGATDIAKLLGLSKYGGPRAVYDRIVGGQDIPVTPLMQRGIREEPRILGLFAQETGAQLAETKPGIIQHPTREYATVSPDHFAHVWDADYTVELKSVSVFASHKYGTADDAVPDDYGAQVRWAMAVTGKPRAVLYAAFGEDDKCYTTFDIRFCRVYRFERDAEIEAAMFSVAERFWFENVLAGVRPPPDPKFSRNRKPKSVTHEASL